MKNIAITLIVLIFILTTFFSGCNESTVSVSDKPANNIKLFQCAVEGEINRFYFILEDVNGHNTICDGNVDFQIIDDLDNILYSDYFTVSSSEFIDYGFQLTGTPIGKAYEWRVPIEDIDKGFSIIGYGTGILTFTNTDGKEMTAQTELVKIPTYTDDEIQDIVEGEYENTSTYINKKISKGNFEIIVNRVGFFYKYDWGVAKKYFRVDMEVKNIGSESEYFLPSGLVIIDSQNNQYEQNYLGTLNIYSTIYPGVVKKGYLLFENIPETETSFRLLFELGFDEKFEPYLFEYMINL